MKNNTVYELMYIIDTVVIVCVHESFTDYTPHCISLDPFVLFCFIGKQVQQLVVQSVIGSLYLGCMSYLSIISELPTIDGG